MKGPTQRSMEWLRKHGFMPGVVERRNPKLRFKTHDLYGCIDLVAVEFSPFMDGVLLGAREASTFAVQATSGPNLPARVQKLKDAAWKSPGGELYRVLDLMLNAGWRVEVHGWRKLIRKKNRWHVRRWDMRKDEEIEG